MSTRAALWVSMVVFFWWQKEVLKESEDCDSSAVKMMMAVVAMMGVCSILPYFSSNSLRSRNNPSPLKAKPLFRRFAKRKMKEAMQEVLRPAFWLTALVTMCTTVYTTNVVEPEIELETSC